MDELCPICGQPLDEENVARCLACGRRFHFAWSVKSDVTNCGRTWTHEDFCGLAFICDPCFRGRSPQPGPPPAPPTS